MISIYVLKDAEGRVRYVGQTSSPLKVRLRGHALLGLDGRHTVSRAAAALDALRDELRGAS